MYGFDFDYTLIHYTVELHKFIYENAKDYLIGKAGVRVCVVCVHKYTCMYWCAYAYNACMFVVVCPPYHCLCTYMLQYPSGLKDMPYDPSFAIRGLHFDLKHVSVCVISRVCGGVFSTVPVDRVF